MNKAIKRSFRGRRTSKVPATVECNADNGIRYYSRRFSNTIHSKDLPMELDAVGLWSPWTLLWFCLFSVAPLAHMYILLMLLRDLCVSFPESIYVPLQLYVPFLARLADRMKGASWIVDFWCVIEALFFIAFKLKYRYLQSRDPLEASLSAAPMYDPEDRKILWDRIIELEKDDLGAFISGWFFDESIENISRYDVCDFLCWCMFDGRNQEHLTSLEYHELESLVEDIEYRISIQLYGAQTEVENKEVDDGESASTDRFEKSRKEPRILSPRRWRMHSEDALTTNSETSSYSTTLYSLPKKNFRFQVDIHREEPTFFSNLYESYKQRYEQYRSLVENSDFHPVKDFRTYLNDRAQQADESARATAHNMYERIIQSGSQVDKQIAALSHATSTQLAEAWNSVKGMKERLETANFLSQKREALMQQLRGNRAMLDRMREMPYAVPSKQMAALMRKITEVYDSLDRVEHLARDGFASATGALAAGKPIFTNREPQRYAKYSFDPLLSVKTFPLGFHLLVLGLTEIPMRVMLGNRGFEKRFIGPLGYYFHPGDVKSQSLKEGGDKVPIVFVHGIGIGLLPYVKLVDCFLKSGRPIFLPEIPYVSGFRPWLSSTSVLTPTVVASTLTAMLATHGYASGVFVGHSYGTSWLSYACKYATNAVAAILFLDPICFCLHTPRLTKNFVYHTPDPGTITYMVRTDMMVNWTIQRAFPWIWITLFIEQIQVPCTVFLSDKDALVPAERMENYFKSKGVPICDAGSVDRGFFDTSGDFNACIFRGSVHGDFTDHPHLLPPIAEACDSLCCRVEEMRKTPMTRS
ncbi:unnamed protein product [Cylindrotheca closterium]|uniref:AB hydrolase-1 domain-containing protein n=1 Tax=Cylindrotheca closterium TaxID=2856 RepID=A0AAD2CSC2_9STRA|nr:unnamed protein product [Cylindrotheca closterium]